MPFDCQKNAKNLTFFFLIAKIFHFFQKIANGNFLKKMKIFGNFFFLSQVFGIFLTVKWQFSGGSGPQLTRLTGTVDHLPRGGDVL